MNRIRIIEFERLATKDNKMEDKPSSSIDHFHKINKILIISFTNEPFLEMSLIGTMQMFYHIRIYVTLGN